MPENYCQLISSDDIYVRSKANVYDTVPDFARVLFHWLETRVNSESSMIYLQCIYKAYNAIGSVAYNFGPNGRFSNLSEWGIPVGNNHGSSCGTTGPGEDNLLFLLLFLRFGDGEAPAVVKSYYGPRIVGYPVAEVIRMSAQCAHNILCWKWWAQEDLQMVMVMKVNIIKLQIAASSFMWWNKNLVTIT
ncbi:hypothetical protein L1987_87278 [Smallanthus sonchifolius]|nr:hypothetical protein L1987_87278 [Smallanthus sonchifolius]